HCVRLVARARHQRGKGQLHALGSVALEDEAVERIEGEKILVVETVRADLGKYAALGCVGINVIKMREIRPVGEIAESREPVRFDVVGGVRMRQARRGGCSTGHQKENTTAG